MNAAKSAVRTLGLVAIALAVTANASLAAQGTSNDPVKSPFDGLGGIGGASTARHDLLASGHDHPSPFDSLGGVGGKGTARAPIVASRDVRDPSPFDSLGGVGGRNTARYGTTLLAKGGEQGSPFDSLGGIGGRNTARSAGVPAV